MNSQANKIKKKEEKVIDAIEGEGALYVEVETTFEFVLGGGAYLPNIDDNFLADRTVTFPISHVVSFDGNKITQIRLSWDQGSLLKLIDVIGKTGRNWPLRDGKDQIKLILNSVAAAGKRTTSAAIPTKEPVVVEEQIRRSRENSTNVTRDPHASLALFAPRESNDEQQALPAVIPPRASAKPPARDYNDLFVGHDSNGSPDKNRPESPFKHSAYGAIAPKAGSGKKFGANRIFDNDENAPMSNDSNRASYVPHPKKYQHFDIASGNHPEDRPEAPPTPQQKTKKGGPSWNFDDFNTPAKAIPTKSLAIRPEAGQDVRHWGTENDEVPDSPVRKPYVVNPRKDFETHFELQDQSPAPKQTNQKENNPREVQAKGITVAGDGMGSRKAPADDREVKQKGITIAGDGMGSRKAPAEEEKARKIYNTAGDGMGGRKGGRSWGFGDESDPEVEAPKVHHKGGAFAKNLDPHFAYTDDSPVPTKRAEEKTNLGNVQNSPSRAPLAERVQKGINVAGDGMGSRKAADVDPDAPRKIYNTAGDGMGGRKGGRSWGFGDESDGEQEGGVNSKGSAFSRGVAPKRAGNAQQTGGGDFWNF